MFLSKVQKMPEFYAREGRKWATSKGRERRRLFDYINQSRVPFRERIAFSLP